VPIDREATLRAAEKLLRQGKLDAAIAEYVRLAAAQPRDWASVNALGDLYVRAGQIDRAVTQFVRVAEQLAREGAYAKAAAVYRKILRLSPLDPRATRGLAALMEKESAAQSGQPVPAAWSPDPDAKVKASRAAQDAGDVPRACALLIEAANLYAAANRPWDAIAAVAEASSVDPANSTYRQRLIRMLIQQGEIVQARYVARDVAELLIVADAYETLGRNADALDIRAEAASFDLNNLGLRHRVLTELTTQGQTDRARAMARSASELLLVAEALTREGRANDAIEAIAAAVDVAPANATIRRQLVQAALAAGDLERARKAARGASDLLAVAEALERCGDGAGARQLRADALRREPDDVALRRTLAREYYAAGEIEQVRWLLTPETAGEDPELLRLMAYLEFTAGRGDEGRRALETLARASGSHADEIARLGEQLAAEGHVDGAFACADVAADRAIAAGDWKRAAAGLEAFVARAPRHVPALMKLVDVCVDGGLNGMLQTAQVQLVDAYLAAGRPAEARIIAEDLVQRAPWRRDHVDRCRRALAMAGEPFPDRRIADMLSADGPVALEDV